MHLNSLVEVQRHHFLHAVLDHLRGEEVGFSFFVNSDLTEVFQQNGADGLGGMGHVDGSIVAHHLTHVGQSATVVQVEVTERETDVAMRNTGSWMAALYSKHYDNQPDDHTVQKVCQTAILDYIREVWEPPLQ